MKQAPDFDAKGIDYMPAPETGVILVGKRRQKAVAEFLEWYARAPAVTEIPREGTPLADFARRRYKDRGGQRRVRKLRNP